MRNEVKTRIRSQAGFTLLELLIVLAILALTAIVTMPLFYRPAADAALTATAQRLAINMRMARAAAIRSNVEQTLTIDLARRSFWVDGVTGVSAIPNGVSVDFTTLQKEQLSARQGQLRFFVDGTATGGNVFLRAGGRTVSVKLDWMTGHASVNRSR